MGGPDPGRESGGGGWLAFLGPRLPAVSPAASPASRALSGVRLMERPLGPRRLELSEPVLLSQTKLPRAGPSRFWLHSLGSGQWGWGRGEPAAQGAVSLPKKPKASQTRRPLPGPGSLVLSPWAPGPLAGNQPFPVGSEGREGSLAGLPPHRAPGPSRLLCPHTLLHVGPVPPCAPTFHRSPLTWNRSPAPPCGFRALRDQPVTRCGADRAEPGSGQGWGARRLSCEQDRGRRRKRGVRVKWGTLGGALTRARVGCVW